MKTKRYEVVEDDTHPDKFRVIDRLLDEFVSVPLVFNSIDEVEEIMGKKSMNELIQDKNELIQKKIFYRTPKQGGV